MASLFRLADGRKRIQFYDGNGKRRSVGLGSISNRNAQRIRDKVEQLVEHRITQTPLDQSVSRWLVDLDEKLHTKLVKAGLTEAKTETLQAGPADVSSIEVTLTGFYDRYLSECSDLKQSSLSVYANVRRNLVEFFGVDKRIKEVTEFDADNFRRFLKSKNYADATTNRRCGAMKTVIRAAVRDRLIPANPFEHLTTTVNGNPSKRRMVSRDEIDRVLAVCPSAEWRLLIVLGRYGGMRVPSEPLCLRWCDIDWANQKINFRQPKNEHREGQQTRTIPLFPELIEPLNDVFEQSAGSEFVITDLRPRSMRDAAGNFASASLTTRFRKIIEKAGIVPWPRPWTNLRASRDTELRERFPSHVVNAWIGHCEQIAQKHYLMVTDEHFTEAAQDSVRKPVRHGHVSDRTAQQCDSGEGRFSAECNEKRPRARARDRQKWTILDLRESGENKGFSAVFR